MKIELLIENVYSSSDLLEESPFIYNPDNIYIEFIKKNNSRYKISGINYRPYVINEETLSNLMSKIVIVPSLGNMTQNELINYNNEKMVLYDITIPSPVLYNGDITPSGLLCVRLGNANDNQELFVKVEEQLSKFMTIFNVGFTKYWITTKLLEEISQCPPDVAKKLVRAYGFKWVLK